MKVAIIHDGLITKGGAERVFLYFCQAIPEADVFSSVYYPDKSYPEFSHFKIRTSWYNRIAKSEQTYRNLYFPLGLLAAKSIDLRSYDVVLHSTTTGAKYARVSRNAKVFSYIHQPFRLLWTPESYPQVERAKGLNRIIFNQVIELMRIVDYKSVQRSNVIIANSNNTANKIKLAYNRRADEILKPPIDCSQFYVSSTVDDYFLVVSRLEPYKRVDLAINVFNELGLPLKIVGDGTQKESLMKLAKSNIDFFQNVSQKDLSRMYSRARALVFPQVEDYGITPLESAASGRPVIGYNDGGLLETMVPFSDKDGRGTALFFNEQTEESLSDAICRFSEIDFDPCFIRSHAESFDVASFKARIRQMIFE